jgi:hypothetical protein
LVEVSKLSKASKSSAHNQVRLLFATSEGQINVKQS